MERILETAAVMADTINVINAIIAAGIAALAGAAICIKRHLKQTK